MKNDLELLLLAVLQGRPRHGYDLIAELRRRSDGAFDIPEGTAYPILHKLEKAGLVASEWDVVDGRKRRVYRLTGAGATAVTERSASWKQYAGAVRAVLA